MASDRSDQRTKHIVLVGIAGVGKSTLVNVLIGNETADVNNDVRPCTQRATQYEVVEDGTRYCIWDTRGLSEASKGFPTRALKFCRIIPDAEREIKELLCGRNPKFDLVLLCVDGRKTRASLHWKVYNSIYAVFRSSRLKVAVVATRFRGMDFRGSEWKEACESAARSAVKKFPDGTLMEAVPEFEPEQLNDPIVRECRSRILMLIGNACSRG